MFSEICRQPSTLSGREIGLGRSLCGPHRLKSRLGHHALANNHVHRAFPEPVPVSQPRGGAPQPFKGRSLLAATARKGHRVCVLALLSGPRRQLGSKTWPFSLVAGRSEPSNGQESKAPARTRPTKATSRAVRLSKKRPGTFKARSRSGKAS